MANITVNNNRTPSTSYFQGIINPWEDYVIYSDNDRDTAIIGTCTTDGNVLHFSKARKVQVYRNNMQSDYNIDEVEYNDTVNVTIVKPYYTYSNSIQNCRNINLTNNNNVMCYVVCFTCILIVTLKLFGGIISRICAKMFSRS